MDEAKAKKIRSWCNNVIESVSDYSLSFTLKEVEEAFEGHKDEMPGHIVGTLAMYDVHKGSN